jgi:hypothetical protein
MKLGWKLRSDRESGTGVPHSKSLCASRIGREELSLGLSREFGGLEPLPCFGGGPVPGEGLGGYCSGGT